jgi:hypothetical protein
MCCARWRLAQPALFALIVLTVGSANVGTVFVLIGPGIWLVPTRQSSDRARACALPCGSAS